MRPRNEVHIINVGHFRETENGKIDSNSTCTLIQSKLGVNIIVDTGGPWIKQNLLREVTKIHKLDLEEIHYVVCTHGHPDNIGNLNLFPKAKIVLGYDIMNPGGVFDFHDWKSGKLYKITGTIYIMPTPGHTDLDLSVIVKETSEGTIWVLKIGILIF